MFPPDRHDMDPAAEVLQSADGAWGYVDALRRFAVGPGAPRPWAR